MKRVIKYTIAVVAAIGTAFGAYKLQDKIRATRSVANNDYAYEGPTHV